MKQNIKQSRYVFFLLLLFQTYIGFAQRDTVSGFNKKITGDEIDYFSPLRQFAKIALLTRCTGQMPIAWEAQATTTKTDSVCFELLIGHSTGTSGGIREFELSINNETSWILSTYPKQKKLFENSGNNKIGHWHFVAQEFDINGDVFGKLFVTVPSYLVKEKAEFRLSGKNQSSRDWMMVFMYSRAFRAEIYASQLIQKGSQKRQLQVWVENPFREKRNLQLKWKEGQKTLQIEPGFNVLQLATFSKSETGRKKLELRLQGIEKPIEAGIDLRPVSKRTLHIIHHSHNDIGYSHHQLEVEKIQTENIRAAIRWTSKYQNSKTPAYWHIESLWAVENFLKDAQPMERDTFFDLVKRGYLILSGNYANILTGLCKPEEQKWALAYAKQLRSNYKLPIQIIMTTDIPGISASALQAYWEEGFGYLSMGPNYVKTYADKGDRIGSMLEGQGDQIFKWKPRRDSLDSRDYNLYVWTAGRGYSMLHGITEQEKQQQWEQRISDYLIDLEEKNYPYQDIQLRYTKNADNGPVDTGLVEFVQAWNQRYESPILEISSLPILFQKVLEKNRKTIPEFEGEISPYWEDGAYSSAAEEIEIRQLVEKTILLQAKIPVHNKSKQKELYQLQRNLVLFHEHTWGAWCSISDPDLEFTTSQWEFKKAFLDSARSQYLRLETEFGTPNTLATKSMVNYSKFTLEPDTIKGGFFLVDSLGIKQINKSGYGFFEPIYLLGTNPMKRVNMELVSSKKWATEESIFVEQIFKCEQIPSLKVKMEFHNQSNVATFETELIKKEIRAKESLHMALPFDEKNNELRYNKLVYPKSQMPGSNKEFICVEDSFSLQTENGTWQMYSPDIALIELGEPQNENQVNGTRLWKRNVQASNKLFLYVFNNYWHTNYKASQSGKITFRFAIKLKSVNP